MKKIMYSILFLGICFGILGFSQTDEKDNCKALDFYKIINEKHISLYEEEIAKEKVVSNITENELTKMALNLKVSVDKLKVGLIFKHALNCAGINITIEKAVNLSNYEILTYGKVYINYLKSTLTPDEIESLKQKFNECKKG